MSAMGLVQPATALAQARSGVAQSPGRWEIEFHVGGARSGDLSRGTSRLPAPDVTFNTINELPTRRVPSWFFGDGALLLNQVNDALGLPASGRVLPLDAVLSSSGIQRRTRTAFGGRVSRRIGQRFSVELSFDAIQAPYRLGPAVMDDVEATVASYETAWQAFFARYGPILNGQVSVFADVQERDLWHTTATAAMSIDLLPGGAVVPYVTMGGGVVHGGGRVASATLAGGYITRHPNGLTAQSAQDLVRVRWTTARQSLAGLVGAGLRGDFTPAVGWRVDARALLSRNRSAVTVSAQPYSAIIGLGSAFATGTSPGIQFSSLAGVMPSLGGAPLEDFETFGGSGRAVSATVSAGVFTRVSFSPADRTAPPGRALLFGVKGGVTAATMEFSELPDEIDIDSRIGGVVGAYLRLPASAIVSFQPEVLASFKGATYTYSSNEGQFRFVYLEFPMLARFALTQSSRPAVFVLAGLAPALRLDARAEVDGFEQPFESETRTFDLGATLGGGIAFGAIEFDLRYTWGLLNVNRVEEEDDEAPTIRHRTLAVLVGFRLW